MSGQAKRTVLSWGLALLMLGAWGSSDHPASAASNPKRPFPQHQAYVAGTVKPNNHPQSEMDGKVKQFYDAWKANFLRQGCGTGRWYGYIGPQASTGEGVPISVSEAQGYAMVIVPLMAGYDPNARTIFDGLYKFFKDHPSQHDPYLMAWRQLEGCGNTSDPNSAADGDLSIAYGLLLAHAQWGSAGAINYKAEAKKVLVAIRKREVHPKSALVQPGDWVNPAYPTEYNSIRTSDVMPGHYRAFGRYTDAAGWTATAKAGYAAIDTLQRLYAPATGLVPDFALDTNTSPRPAYDGFIGESGTNRYQYNACRVPWRLGVDYLLSGDSRAKTSLLRMEDWLYNTTGGNIYEIYAGYFLDGTKVNGYNYVCYTGAFGVGAMIDKKYQPWVNKIWDDIAITFIDTPSDHYGATLRLMYMLVMSGNWWAP